MTQKRIRHLNPPENCDLCHKPVGDAFVDGKTKMGPWANMCYVTCFPKYGVGLGTGKGQHYVKLNGKDYIKVEG